MKENSKKPLIILLLLVIVAVVIFVIFFSHSPAASSTKDTIEGEASTTLPVETNSATFTLANLTATGTLQKSATTTISQCELNGFCTGTGTTSPKGMLTLGNTTIGVGFADTEAEQQQGLSGRASLPSNEGLLFIFPTSNNYGFWMKDMNFSLDIMWIDAAMNVVYIKADAKPEDYPAVYQPSGSARYVLEVNAGFAAEHGVTVGSRVSLSAISH